jgi:uncharacterized spore protein YtfJ
MTIQENIDQLFDKFENFIKEKTVIGEPFQIGEITLIPTLSITFGLGTGTGEGAKQSGGNGAGMGSRVVPIAMIVIKNGEISVLPIKKNAGLDKLLDMVPDLMEKIKDFMPEKGKKEIRVVKE